MTDTKKPDTEPGGTFAYVGDNDDTSLFGLDFARTGSVERCHDASALAGSIVPSGSTGTRPCLMARSTATWLTPRRRA